ncbi:NADH-quinone oxidoreductase subunit M [Sinimarinibacterium flocculans]|uniref:NADH-quinone oxidoreductase subunit M n=1 Tax=Sinimarinibacterium flocculans TaxID=985250 RepID=A0A318E5D6_9GAMM|nr:NADH-quinone oxidoreductase subunit M [Sinimarinibacterium flocculans]PXV66486.1 NADH dehydrogenase subunit M [Sinimarinibacterium flocculans]
MDVSPALNPWLLPALILVPFFGGLLAWYAERWSLTWPRWIGLLSMAATCVLAIWIWAHAGVAPVVPPHGSPEWIIEFRAGWIPRWGVSFHLGIDGLGLLMVLLTGVLGVLSVACSWREIQQYVGFFHLNLLWNLAGVMGVFMALDLFLFFVFWEAMLVPMYFLIALWGHSSQGGSRGGRSRVYAATKFFIFTQASGLLMLVGILALVWLHQQNTGEWSFSYAELLYTPLSSLQEMLLMLAFFLGFAVKLPVFPLHPWLPDAHSQAPTAGSVDLAGVLLKTGAYGLLRFVLPLFPNASMDFAPVAMALAILGILYGAKMALVQTDIKRLVAYTSVSHMGFVLLGIYAGTTLALQGALLLMLAHGLATGALFILCGELYERLHSRELGRMGGLTRRAPHYATALMFFALASLGLPGLGNFVGEFLVLFGSFAVAPWITAIAATGLILAAVYSLYIVQRALHGPPADDTPIEDLTGREKLMMAFVMLALLALGLYPQPVIDLAFAPLAQIANWYALGVPGA